ncbi:hypothetical protein Pint_15650 [Pistacia integerrima]|uniref:Uncharacterized protein n=1 Tax=Pistacia integerrima TaxID=434235 RepID=A0ACC0ZBL3_9ROSI|nr:hypothetical protein Pint_15650 [Pistacia integerrima]
MTEEYETYRRMDKKFQEAYHCCLDNKNKLEYPDKRLEDLKAELLNWHDGMNVQEQNSGDVFVRQLDDDNRGRNTTVFDPFVTRSYGCPRSNRYRSRHELCQNNIARNQRAC